MNPFRSRKKSLGEGDAGKSRISLDSAPPMPAAPKTDRGLTFRRKKQQPEPKPEIDLKTVLPSTDEFRTSLLMPNLSARFSMLREQDDPTSKLGKANDDSVLFPRRQSKLNLFSPEGLSDIAEVSSLAGSIKPPFAFDRTNSYSSMDNAGYGTDDDASVHGSIMSRSKPGQGNKFFGGRQKVYKVIEKGQNGTNENGTRPMGKQMYEDDVHMSAFQKQREERKQRGSLDDQDERSSGENHRSGSPPPSGYNRNRETSSSTNSGPAEGRTSTAATSIASQPGSTWYASNGSTISGKPSPVTTPGIERPHKGKRLYGQGLDKQMMEQQSSALNRLNSIQRNGFGGVGASRSTSNLNERFNRSGFFSPGSDFRSASPSPASTTPLNGFDFGTNGEGKSRSNSRDHDGAMSRPMSPHHNDPTFMSALDANDVGKATASGAFNKPKSEYNEQQFAQRQLQLQEGRESPVPRAFSRQGSHTEYNGRLRKGSQASNHSAQSFKNQMRTGPNSRAPSSASIHRTMTSPPLDTHQASTGVYLAEGSGSEYDTGSNSPETDLPTLKPATYQKPNSTETVTQSTIYEHDDQHPAFRNQPQPDRLYIEPSDDDDEGPAKHAGSSEQDRRPNTTNPVDSPTLGGAEGPDNLGAGLSDLVRGHLRQQSNASSVYPDSPEPDQENRDEGPWKPAPTSNVNERSSFDHQIPSTSQLGSRARQVLEQASQLANANNKVHDVLGGVGADKVQQVLGGEAPRRSNDDSSPFAWQEHLKGHNRGASTETQKEREDFANELADRRKLVQEKLKNFTEDSMRSNDSSPAKSGPFGLLKKSSRGSLVQGNDNPSKAAKMLGIGAGATPPNGHSPNIQSNGFRNGTSSRDPSRGPYGRAPEPTGMAGPPDGNAFRDRSIGAERREKFFRKANPSPHSNIERFNSGEATAPPPPAPYGFPRSRTDPANQPMSFHPAGRARKYSPPRPTTVAATMDVPQEPSSRSNSAMGQRAGPGKSPAGSYFPPHSASPANGPASPQNMTLPPTMGNPRPSPVAPGFSAHTTPPLEMPPHMQPPQPPTMVQNSAFQSVRGAPRKRSINKQEISEPTFLSGTSSVVTVDLPQGASLSNGMDRGNAPPVPPINPRRRRAQPTQNLFTAFGNKSPGLMGTQSQPSSAHPGTPEHSHYEERSTFSGDENEDKPNKPRSRLRKTSSEGGMAAKARHHALMKEAEQMPGSPGSPRR